MTILAMFEPDRPHNFGSALRLCACLGISLHIIEPCGFPLDERRIREAALDYSRHVEWRRHGNLDLFMGWLGVQGGRLVLLSTSGTACHHEVRYRETDVFLTGRETSGVPECLHHAADLRVRVPQSKATRSLNVITAATLVLGEAMRQLGAFDRLAAPDGGSLKVT
jgi:tRNA (cytidine/uridine-2'-O-)-methyltransferase